MQFTNSETHRAPIKQELLHDTMDGLWHDQCVPPKEITDSDQALPPTRSPKTKPGFISDVSGLISSQVIIAIFAMGSSVITARALGSEGRGYFALAMLFASMLVTFSDFGMGASGPRLTAMRRWPVPEILGSHVLAGTVRVLITGIIGLALIAFARDVLFPDVPTEFLVLALLLVVPFTMAGFVLPLLLGLGLAATYSRLLVLSSALAFAGLSVGWVILGLDVRTALLLQLAAGLVTSLIIWRQTSRAAGGLSWPKIRYLGEAYRFGMGVYASNVAAFANTRLVWLLINSYVGAAAVGLYTIAQTATERVYLLADALGTILLPRVAEDPERNSARLTPIVFRLALIVGIGVSVGLALVADWLVRFLFSNAFAGAVPTLRLLLVAVVLSSGWRVLSQDLNGRGHSGQTAIVNGSATVLGLGLATLLLPRLGLEGAAWSAIAAAAMSLLAGIWLFGGSEGIATLLVPSRRERDLALQLLRGSTYAVELGPGFAWALARAYLLDGFVLRLVALMAPLRRRIADVADRLTTPAALHRARRLQKEIATRPLLRQLVQIDSLGLQSDVVKTVHAAACGGEPVALGEFDHYGWLIPTFGPIDGMPCRMAERARPRTRGRILLVATGRGIGVRKEYRGPHARRRFIVELRVLERLRGSAARVPEVMSIDVDGPALTVTFIPGADLERLLEAMGARLTGATIRERLGGNPTGQAILDEYMNEGAKFAAHLDPSLLQAIHEQVRIVHRHGVELYDIKYGNIIIHRETGLPYLTDFDGARLHNRPQGLGFLIERDRDTERLNRAFGTSYLTYDRIRSKLRRREFPATDGLYASAYIGHGLRIGSLWDPAAGFGRWHFILKRNLRLPKGARVLSLGSNNASIELHLLREGAADVIAYEHDKHYVAQGHFLAAACEWADNQEYRLRYVLANMQEAVKDTRDFDCTLALCSLYYLTAEEMHRVARAIRERSPRFIIQCNVRGGIGREDPDQYRRASVEFAIELLQESGFDFVTVTAPRGYSRPLVDGVRP